MKNIRTLALALALIKNEKNQFFLQEGFDSIKKEKFYRPLGGGIEFGEFGEQALKREFLEEINEEIAVGELLKVFENIFTFEGTAGHEVVLIYSSKFIKQENCNKEFDINEDGQIVGKAVWKSISKIKEENSILYPLGLESII